MRRRRPPGSPPERTTTAPGFRCRVRPVRSPRQVGVGSGVAAPAAGQTWTSASGAIFRARASNSSAARAITAGSMSWPASGVTQTARPWALSAGPDFAGPDVAGPAFAGPAAHMPRGECTCTAMAVGLRRRRGGELAAGVLAVHHAAAQEGLPDDAGQGLAVVGRDGVLVLELGDVHHEGLVRGEDGEVGVVAERQLALVRAGAPGRRASRPSRTPPAPAGCRGAGLRSRSATGPAAARRRRPRPLRSHRSPGPSGQVSRGSGPRRCSRWCRPAGPCQRSSRLEASRMGGQHLYAVAPSGISSAMSVR